MPVCHAVQPLVGATAGQWAESLDVRAGLNVVEYCGINILRQFIAARVPGRVQGRDRGMEPAGKPLHLPGAGIPAHETDAGYAPSVAPEKEGQFGLVQLRTSVLLEMRAVTAGAMVRTPGDVYRQGGLVRNFGEDDIAVVVSHGDVLYIVP